MMAISLWQPWATGIARGFKAVETRSWATRYRGPLAVHAAKVWNAELREAARRLLGSDEDLPRGALVCTCRLVDCKEMTSALIAEQTDLERTWGGWAPGRFAWFLEDVQVLRVPFAVRGRQGLFESGWPPKTSRARRDVAARPKLKPELRDDQGELFGEEGGS